MRNALFYVAKEEGSKKVLGVAMWMKPKPAGAIETWWDWYEGWNLWFNQVGMNLWYGRGGLNVKVSLHVYFDINWFVLFLKPICGIHVQTNDLVVHYWMPRLSLIH